MVKCWFPLKMGLYGFIIDEIFVVYSVVGVGTVNIIMIFCSLCT